jgi:phosphatidylserine decarboxylase
MILIFKHKAKLVSAIQSLLNSVLNFLPRKIHEEGIPFIIIFAIISFVLGIFFSDILGWAGTVLTIWCVFFFRDPDRITPQKEGLIVSPADGMIQKIEQASPPAELNMGDEPRTRISVFLNVFNVHVNRVPISGKVIASHYHPGKFFNAELDKASEHNERQSVLVRTDNNKEIAFVQIAGLIARRIVCDLYGEETVKTGERFGIIRFGSRVDIYLPKTVNPLVCKGQTVIGGETVLADISSMEKTRIGVSH